MAGQTFKVMRSFRSFEEGAVVDTDELNKEHCDIAFLVSNKSLRPLTAGVSAMMGAKPADAIADVKDLQRRLEELEETNEAIQDELARARKLASESQAAVKELEAAKKQVGELNENNNTLAGALASVKQKCADLQAELDKRPPTLPADTGAAESGDRVSTDPKPAAPVVPKKK